MNFKSSLKGSMVLGIGFPDAISPMFERLLWFHDMGMTMLISISVLMVVSMWGVCTNKSFSCDLLDKKTLEIVWTVVPACVLVGLAMPSMSLLYFMDDPVYFLNDEQDEKMGGVMKIMGHQWYWSYEYNLDGVDMQYDSFMVPTSELEVGGYRLLEADKPLMVNVFENVLLEGMTSDVIHSWTCPPIGVKFDVVPGRLKSVTLMATQMGVFFGQCSEMCGANHSFMPIMVEVV